MWNSIDVGGRCSIMRIPAEQEGAVGGLAVYSPVDLSEALASSIEALGGPGVKVIICPNYEHLKYAKQWSKAYPDAEMWACPALPEHNEEMRGIKWSKTFGSEDDSRFLEGYVGE